MTEQQPNPPTEAEIAMSHEIWGVLSMTLDDLQSIISRHNAPLHAKLAAQKAALELAKEAISEVDSRFEGNDVYLRRRSALSKIKEALQ